MSGEPLILMTPPERLRRARELNVEIAHRAYRLGQGPHLYRAGPPASGGLMAINDRGFDGRGDGGALCGEILRECTARGFHGAVLDFEQGCKPVLERVIRELEEGFARTTPLHLLFRQTPGRPPPSILRKPAVRLGTDGVPVPDGRPDGR